MPWGKVDDGHYDHQKVLDMPRRIRNAADGLYWRAISRCNRTLSDGWLTAGDLALIDAETPQVEALVTVGLMERRPDGRLRIHDYLVFNKSKAEVLKERRTKEEAGRAGGLASGRTRAKQARKQTRSKREAPASGLLEANANEIEAAGVELPSRPVPSRPDPSALLPDGSALTARPPNGEPDRHGLPHITTAVQEAGEAITGQGMLAAGENQLTELDRQVEVHGEAAVIVAMQTAADGKRFGWRKLVWDSLKLLEPFADGKPAQVEAPLSPRDEEYRRMSPADRRKADLAYITEHLVKGEPA